MLKKTTEISVVFKDRKREETFQIKHKIGKNSFTRTRKLGFDKIMTMMIKKSNKSLQNSINDTQLALGEDVTISNSAYTQARAKLNYTAFEEFAQMAAEIFYKDGEYETYKGFRILAVDGSITTLPNTEDVKKEFNPMKVKCQIKDFAKDVSQARVSCLFDVLNNISLDSCIVNKNSNEENNLIAYDERTLAVQHFEYCKEDDLVIMDRGYPSYELFVAAYKRTNILCRIRKNIFTKAKFLFDAHSEKKDVILEINAPKYLRDDLRSIDMPTKMKVRFVQVILDNGTVEVLATNVLDNEKIKTSDFKELYSMRWGIETYFDLIKNKLSLENFTGQSALAVKQDFFNKL